jgi:hypothetical protein
MDAFRLAIHDGPAIDAPSQSGKSVVDTPWSANRALSNLLIGMSKQETEAELHSCLRRNLVGAYEDGIKAAQEVAMRAGQFDLAKAIIALREGGAI